MITADMVRDIITGHDRSRPRSKQTKVGPSDLSSPCDRRLVYQLLGVDRPAASGVNLAAWVGTGIHAQMEAALKGHPDWLTETPIDIDIAEGVNLTGHADAFHIPSGTVVDYKSCGPSALAKYRVASPAKYRMQIAIYALGLTMAGHTVNHCALAYIPRNGTLADIHVDAHPWDQSLAERAIRRYEALIIAASAGTSALAFVPVADDCKFCPWWVPGWPGDTAQACPGAQAAQTTGDAPAESNPTQPERKPA